MKRCVLWVVCAVFMLCVISSASKAFAEHQHSVGLDVMRLFDEGNYGGMFGASYQISMTPRTAFVGTIARRSGFLILEGLWKVYGHTYFDGPFVAVGLAGGTYHDKGEIGLMGSLGYEKSLARNVVLSGRVDCTWGTMDHPTTAHRSPIFRSGLDLVFAF
ncbi:MAG: hypothetical protein MI742_05505 [Desulfobacterales bacterium]|nr:hypothetical protein [Desulfobacterales bacterium]